MARRALGHHARRSRRWRVAVRAGRVGPQPADRSPVPGQQGGRGDGPLSPQLRGNPRTSADSTARSGQDSHGRSTCQRRMVTSWRSTSSSATITTSPRVACGNQPEEQHGSGLPTGLTAAGQRRRPRPPFRRRRVTTPATTRRMGRTSPHISQPFMQPSSWWRSAKTDARASRWHPQGSRAQPTPPGEAAGHPSRMRQRVSRRPRRYGTAGDRFHEPNRATMPATPNGPRGSSDHGLMAMARSHSWQHRRSTPSSHGSALGLYGESDPKPVIRRLAEQLGVHRGSGSTASGWSG
jgi:hypothetical protein